ncbi:MAG TPA: DUF4388 domain-containing protein, partial [Vicinamibacteria bacterium]|nr:DUF4388 domain-containing protein [Vicinamibacteria bacterium]
PPEEREALALGLSRLNESRQALASKVEIVHRQSGAPESVTRAAAASAQQAAQAAQAAPQVLSAVVQGLGRLPLLLRRLEQFALTRAAPAAAHTASAAKEGAAATRGAPEAHLTAGRSALVADAVLEASLQAKDGPELDQYLERIRKLGVVAGTDEIFRALGRSVSGWALPAADDVPALPEGGQVSAMRRMIALADEPAEAGRRFREMVHAAIEQFNEGTYGRSLKMFDLARQMVEEGQVKTAFVEPMVLSGHEYLAEERVRKLAERPEGHFFLRPVLSFFRAYSPDRLLDELQAEHRRDRRHQLLNLLEANGTPARAAAWGRLQADPEGRVAGLYFLRNLVYLLRTIPRPDDTPWRIEEEIDVLAPLVEPGRPLFLVKEALQCLVASRHPWAESHLVAQLEAVEEALLERTASAEDRKVLLIHLDRAAAALARLATPLAWAAIVEHALGRQASFGDPLSRLAELSTQDLSPAPTVVARLREAIEENLPRGVLGRLVPGREATLTRLVAALGSTRAPEVLELLSDLASRYAGQAFGREAQKVLAALDQKAAASSAVPSISGDLDLFGLPNLLQNLSELAKTGVLNLLDVSGRPIAALRLEEGVMYGARCGTRRGREAVYQLIERPFPATFAFVRGGRPEEPDAEKLSVTHLLLEGVRRHDHLQRALALVPDDVPLEASGKSPSSVPDEVDYDLVVALWQKACEGTPPREIESGLPVDSYRVFRCLAHWVEEGALRPRPATAA